MNTKCRNGKVDVAMIVIVVVLAIGLFVAYNAYEKHNRRLEREERIRQENARIEREQVEAKRREAEQKAELERERQRKEQERVEAEREAARMAAKKKLEEEAAERNRQIREKELCRSEYAAVREMFRGYEAKIWDDEDPVGRPTLDVTSSTNWYVFASHENDRLFYRTTVDDKGKAVIQSLDGISPPANVDEKVFLARCKSEKNAVLVDGAVWLRGMPKNSSCYAIPNEGREFVAASVEGGGLYGVITGLGVKFGAKKYRLQLRTADGRQSVVLGIFGYDTAVPRDSIVDVISSALSKGRKQGAQASTLGKPKLKKYRPTVVFYDGVLVKKDISGVTHIPRQFEYRGTSRYGSYDADAVEAARNKWEALRDEAVRQEDKAAEVEEENRRLMAEFEEKKRQLAAKQQKMAKVTADDIERESKKWLIQVERSRAKKK